MTKELFKEFVHRRTNLDLANAVNKGSMTWQKFYEMFDMYGENSPVWDNYLLKPVSNINTKNTSLTDIVQMVKGIDLETVRKGIDGVQKAIGLVQGFTSPKVETPSTYSARPMYKYFED
ncbi:MAG: spore coat protein YlbD [Bacilli bacterium]